MKKRAIPIIIAVSILSITVFLVLQIWLTRLGSYEFANGDYEGALPVLKAARVLNPFTDAIPAMIAEIYINIKDFDNAEKILAELLKSEPENAKFHNLRGVVLQARGKLDEALAEYATAVKLDPNNAIAHLNIGYAQMKKGNFNEARLELKEAVRLNPELEKNVKEALDLIRLPSPIPQGISANGENEN